MQNLLPSATSVLQFGQPCRTSPSGTDKCIAEAIGVAVKFGLKAFRLGRPHRLSPKAAAHRTRAADRQLKCREARLRDDFRTREFGYNCNRMAETWEMTSENFRLATRSRRQGRSGPSRLALSFAISAAT